MSTIIIDMIKKSLVLTILLLMTTLYSQEMKLYAPFPSRINTKVSGREVTLSWKDAKDVTDGTYEIFRSNTAITADNLHLAEKIGESPSTTEIYVDTPPVDTDIFYAVFTRDSSQTYKICIPYRNVTTNPIKIAESDIEETISSVISQLTTGTSDTEVLLEFMSSLSDRSIIIFRSTSTIDNYANLIKSINISEETGSSINYTDTPLAGIDYYYAAVDGDLYRSGNKNLLYEGNYTVIPVQVKFSHQVEEDALYVKSTMPLPLLKVSADLESGELLNERKSSEPTGSISTENINSINRLIDRQGYVHEEMSLTTLSYNKNINHIISNSFLNRRWSNTVSELEYFTSLNFEKETRTQSHFYRGQAYFFQGLYNNALLEFIMIEKDLYVETQPWFSAIYKIKNSTN